MPNTATPPAPLYPPKCPQVQAALAALANLREISQECDGRVLSPAAARDFRRGTLAALDALMQAVVQTAWRAELALTAAIEKRP